MIDTGMFDFSNNCTYNEVTGEKMIKTIDALLQDFKDYKNPYAHIKLLVNNGVLIKLKRGIYETNKDVAPFALAAVLYAPSYISFQSALSYYGIIPERTESITSASLNAKKNKNYSTPLGYFSFQDVPSSAFSKELRLIENEESSYMMATPEKAMCDYLSKIKAIRKNQFNSFLFDDLRVDREKLKCFRKNTVNKLAKYYKKTNVQLLADFLKGEK
jgi:hypothetical protein